MVLFDRLTKRAEDSAELRRQRLEAAWAAVPGITIRHEGTKLILSGRALKQRWLDGVRLRFARWTDR